MQELTEQQKKRLKLLAEIELEGLPAVANKLFDIEDELDSVREEGKGDRGNDGRDGKDGLNGIDGKDGRDGVDGKDGKDGVDGKDGKDGVDGRDGQDGSPDTPNEIVEKINKSTEIIDEKKVGLNKYSTKEYVDEEIKTLQNRTQLLLQIATQRQTTVSSGGGTWGSITGTLSNQTDLQTALDGKVDENVAITGATKTKITYDAKGLVTAGADATTADIADSSNKRYVTDAQLVVIGNTSGTNTGDNATNSQYSGLVTNATHTGDATGATALTVVAINGTNLAALGTGVLKNTTGTGVPFISKVVLTEPATAATLTIADNQTLTVNGSATITNGTHSGTNTGDQTIASLGLDADLATFSVPASTTISAFGATLVDDADASTARTTLGLVIGTNVQAYDADLTTWAGITPGTGVGTALAVNVGTAGAFVVNGGALGTPSSGTLTNCTFPTLNQNTTGSAAKWTTARNLAGNSVDGSADVAFANKFIVQGTTDAGLSGAQFLGALGTGIVKNTTTTGVLSIAVAGDFPTLNQSTTGSAATLTTARAIYGNNFDGSAALTQIIASTYGGTGNGFTKFSGPATTEKTFTLPNASATILTDNAVVTVAQGGTGRATSTTAYGLLAAGTTATGAHQTLAAGATTEILVGGGAAALPVWTTATGTGAPARADSPTFTTQIIAPTIYGSSASGGDLVLASTSHATKGMITLGSGETDGQVGIGNDPAAGTGLYFYKDWSSNDATATAIQFYPIFETTTTGRTGVSIGAQIRPAAAIAQITGFGTLIQFGAGARQNTTAWNVTTLTGNQIRLDELAGYSATVSTAHVQNIAAGVKGGTGTWTTMNVINIPAGHGTFGATNVRGFHGAIAAGTNIYNIYNDGTAQNYFAGKVGCGIAVPTTDLHVYGADNATHVTVENAATSANTTAADVFVDFRSSSGSIGTIAGTASSGVIAYNTFTGSHWAKSDTIKSRKVVKQSIKEVEHLEDDLTTTIERIVTDVDTYESDLIAGTVLVSTDDRTMWEGEEEADYLPMVKVSSKKEDKAVYGVYGGHDRDGDILVLALGAGRILVTDENGAIEVGDFLCTSSTKGHAMRYTGSDMRVVVAKARGSHKSGKGLIPCTYLAG